MRFCRRSRSAHVPIAGASWRLFINGGGGGGRPIAVTPQPDGRLDPENDADGKVSKGFCGNKFGLQSVGIRVESTTSVIITNYFNLAVISFPFQGIS